MVIGGTAASEQIQEEFLVGRFCGAQGISEGFTGKHLGVCENYLN